MKDFYYILGIEADCSFEDIREAYRKLSKKFHPDLNQNDKYFEGRFREIHEAYEVLSNPTRRVKYDSELKRFKSAPNYQPPPKQGFKTRGIDIGFTIILILITVIFGSYVYKALNSSKTIKPITSSVANAIVYETPKHHKRKHFLKKAVTDFPKVSSASTTIQPAQIVKAVAPAVIVPIPVKPAALKPYIDTPKTQAIKRYLYTTNVKGNLTGVINMHRLDKFSSAVVTEIPNNSQVLVLARGDSYYKVEYNNETGYVPKWTLQDK